GDLDLACLDDIRKMEETVLQCDRIVLAHGWLTPQDFQDMPGRDMVHSFKVNLLSSLILCEMALTKNPRARIVVIGSESGQKGSHDLCYALAKSGLHKYVEERRVGYPDQQLVCVAPSLIADGAMTVRRQDQARVR